MEWFLPLGMVFVLLLSFGFGLVGFYFMSVVQLIMTYHYPFGAILVRLWYQDYASLVHFPAAAYPKEKYCFLFAAGHSVCYSSVINGRGGFWQGRFLLSQSELIYFLSLMT